MKKSYLLALSIYVTLICFFLFEALYYLDFFPINIYRLLNISTNNKFLSFIFFLLCSATFFFLFGIILNRFSYLFKTKKNIYLIILILYFVINLTFKITDKSHEIFNPISQIALFCINIIVFDTFFYSILFSNLLK